jgi:hypothetical protein
VRALDRAFSDLARGGDGASLAQGFRGTSVFVLRDELCDEPRPAPRAVRSLLATAALFAGLSLAPRDAAAQDALEQNSRHRALSVYGGGLIGIKGAGAYFRGSFEYLTHFNASRTFEGHAFGVGPSFVWWSGQGGPIVSAAPRYQYDLQIVSGLAFFLSPYVGVEAGVGFFTNGPELVLTPNAGVDVKMVIRDRFVLAFRPMGISAPIFIGGRGNGDGPRTIGLRDVDVLWDVSLSLGLTL